MRYDGFFKMNKKQAEKINLWRSVLLKVQQNTPNYNFTLFWSGQQDPPVGRFSTYEEMVRHIKSKKDFGWTHYDDQTPVPLKDKIE